MNPTLGMISIRDIAHAGSQLCRFTGHTKFFYSIAQHELLGSYLVPRENALEFLLHDSAESYVNDMSTPLKHFTECGKYYRPVEDKIQILIRNKFGLPRIQSPVIKEVDTAMLLAEKDRLMPGSWTEEEKIAWDVVGRMADVDIYEHAPRYIEATFLSRFEELTKGE